MIERTGRVVAPAALAMFVVIGVSLSARTGLVAVGAGLVAVGLGIVLAVRSLTGWPLVAGCAAAAAAVAVVCNGQPSNLGWFAVCVLAGWCALVATVVQTLALGVPLAAMFVAQWVTLSDEPGWGAWIAGTAFTMIACQMAQRQRLLLEQLREAQAGLSDRAKAEERNRIAREMHDVIGHALTVSLLHVSSARLALDEDPDEARASLLEAERLARQSLAEVRAAVGLMRDSTSGEVAPMPGARDIEGLLESFRKAGTTVSCEVVGDPGMLTATGGLTVYRILQEALTNVARHAPGSPATVRVEVADGRTRVVVDSAVAPGVESHDGAGLIGMRERAEAIGGRLSAGPWQSGWRVEAVLPR